MASPLSCYSLQEQCIVSSYIYFFHFYFYFFTLCCFLYHKKRKSREEEKHLSYFSIHLSICVVFPRRQQGEEGSRQQKSWAGSRWHPARVFPFGQSPSHWGGPVIQPWVLRSVPPLLTLTVNTLACSREKQVSETECWNMRHSCFYYWSTHSLLAKKRKCGEVCAEICGTPVHTTAQHTRSRQRKPSVPKLKVRGKGLGVRESVTIFFYCNGNCL